MSSDAELACLKKVNQDLSPMSSDAELARNKKANQGKNECEVLSKGAEGLEGAEGLKEWVECRKNKGHTNFIPALDFTINDLPEGYRESQLFEYTKHIAILTVRVLVFYTSHERPDGYTFSKHRGEDTPHFGSGCVIQCASAYDRKVLGKPCPCRYCEKSGKPESKWYECIVITARHVVYNEEEARQTTFELFFNDTKRENVKNLYGIGIVDANSDDDRCEVRCVTHDKEVADELKHTQKMSVNIHRTLSKGGYAIFSQVKANLCVVISHPHGRSKCITIGNWTECLKKNRREGLDEQNSSTWYETCVAYKYDTPTCLGSSGGPTIILGLWDAHWSYILAGYYFCHTHKEGDKIENGENGKNQNTSSYWLVHAE